MTIAKDRRTFLGVERSIGGQRWVHALDARAEATSLRMAQTSGLPEIVCRILARRGVPPEKAASFLAPTIRDLMPDPSTLTDMDAAASRLADAIEKREAVAIIGDYDVDGAASAALLWRYLRHFGLDAAIRIPDRIIDGYGPNVGLMREVATAGARLVVTVDCGTSSLEALAEAASLGMDAIVLDHHQPGRELPRAFAVVNPNREDDLSGQGPLCAAGVVFMTLVATSRELRRRGQANLPDLLEWLDLAALATVCDVVPLTGLNRALVVRGMTVLRRGRNVGLQALAATARLGAPADTYHLGFILGPRINAGGRIGEAGLGARLLTTDDRTEAETIAAELDLLNSERQAMERWMLAEAEAEVAVEIGTGEGPAVLVVAGATWHAGVVGLIAARLKERWRRPAFAIAFDATGAGAGSGRSVFGIDLGRIVREAVEAGILARGGGHAMAAGLSLDRGRLGDFRAFVEGHAAVAAREAAPMLAIDGALAASGASPGLVAIVEQAGPFGAGHPQPVFALPRHKIVSAAVVGGNHVRAQLRAGDGNIVSAIAFRSVETELGRRLLKADGVLHFAGSLSLDRYRGREAVSFRIADAAGIDD